MIRTEQYNTNLKDQTILGREDSYKLPSQIYLEKKQNSVDSETTYTTSKVTMLRHSYQSTVSSVNTVTWVNRAEEIIKSEVGPQEYDQRMQRQTMLFEKGCKKGGFTEVFSTYMKSKKIRSHFESATKEVKKRASHTDGIGALGYCVFDPEQKVPLNEFFSQGRVFEVRARHSNNPWSDDDRKTSFRSLSLKLADHPKESPLDFVFQTGYISKFFNAEAMEEHILAMEKKGEYVKRHLLSLPVYLEASIEGFRKMPESYYHQHYHSQMVYDFAAKDEKKRVCRFRIVPSDGSPESGRLSPTEQRDAWFFMLMDNKDSDVSPNYLKLEFKDRVRRAPVVYKLQIQLHEITEEDNHMIYNPSIAWEASEHPWLHLATINLTSILPNEVTEMTRFNIGKLPTETINFPEGTSIYDFNIIPTLRKEIYEYCQKLRPLVPTIPKEGPAAEYLVHVVTGSQNTAGNADAKCGIYVCLIGSEGRTSYRRLERKLKSDFAPGAKTTFNIHDKIVGEFLCIKIFKDKKGPKTDWFLEYLILTCPYNNKCYKLQCYRWLTDDNPMVTLRTTAALLDLQEKNSYLRLQRSMETANKKSMYPWVEKDRDEQGIYHGFPGYTAAGSDATHLPKDFRLQNEKALDTQWNKHIAAGNSFMRTIKNMFKSRKGPIDVEYSDLVTELCGKERPESLEHVIVHWKDDQEFVRQLLNCLVPLKVAECKALPANFPVTDHIVEGLLEDGKTLKEEIGDGKIFIITFPEFEEFCQYELDTQSEYDLEAAVKKLGDDNASLASTVQLSFQEDGASLNEDVTSDEGEDGDKTKKKKKKAKKPKTTATKKKKPKPPKELKKHLCAPQVLLYNKNGVVIPLAIQLSQDPPEVLHGQPPLIYTLKDNGGEYSDWLVAKMWVKCAAAHVHHLSMHVLGTHLLMEPVAMSVLRNLPTSHPIFKLLVPHLRHVVAMNSIYRKHVLPYDKAMSEFLGIGQDDGQMLDFLRQQYNNFKLSLLNLPDGFAEKGVLEEEVLPGYHYRDDTLRLWEAIQDFVTDIVSIYYEADKDILNDKEMNNMVADMRRNGFHRRAEIPEKFSNHVELVKFLTNVIYRCSVHHSVHSSMMADMYTFAPNAPPCMMRPPPTIKRGITGWDEDVVRFMLPPPDLVERYVETMRLMNNDLDETRLLGRYPDQLFTETQALNSIKKLNNKLKDITKQIKKRNEKLDTPYEYFLPENILSNIMC